MGRVSTRSAAAHQTAVQFSISDIAGFLQETLGQKLVAHVAGVADPKAVAAWASGARTPRSDAENRLRTAFQAFRLVQDDENAHVARAWFIGLNPQLADEAPADVLREGRLKAVLAAARAYVAGG